MIYLPPSVVETIHLEVRRPPRPKARHRTRVMRIGGQYLPQEYEDPDGRREEEAFELLARRAAPDVPHDGPVRLANLWFHIAVPSSWDVWEKEAALAGTRLPEGKSDLDNYVKFFMDALTRGGRWWADDSKVIALGDVRKRYVPAEQAATLADVEMLEKVTSAERWYAIRAAAGGPPAPAPRPSTKDLFAKPV